MELEGGKWCYCSLQLKQRGSPVALQPPQPICDHFQSNVSFLHFMWMHRIQTHQSCSVVLLQAAVLTTQSFAPTPGLGMYFFFCWILILQLGSSPGSIC